MGALVLMLGQDCGFVAQVGAIYEKHKGVNDWHLEHIGEIQDLKFVEEADTVYAVSKDGLLVLFNTATQDFEWKKRLSGAGQTEPAEVFHLRYLSRNLLVFSQLRAMLVNTAGHANMEIDFGAIFGTSAVKALQAGKATPIADLFDFNGRIVTCFVFGNKAVLYADAQYWDAVPLDDSIDAGVTDHDVIEVLQMLYDQSTQRLTILVRTNANTLKSVVIELSNLSVEIQAKVAAPAGLTAVSRTLSFFVLQSGDRVSVVDPSTLQDVHASDSSNVQTSQADDLLLIQNAEVAKLVDLKVGDVEHKLDFASGSNSISTSGCSPLVRHEATQGTPSTIKLA